jgi:small GTP-binding protein
MALKKKICILGSTGAGKTSLIRRFVKNEFSENYLSTIGVQVSKKDVFEDANPLTMIIWDVEGFDEKTPQIENYLSGSAGAFIVADLLRQETVKHIEYVAGVFLNSNPKGRILVVGNKLDLVARNFNDNTNAIENYCRDSNYKHFFTSAKTGENVESAFRALGALILNG